MSENIRYPNFPLITSMNLDFQTEIPFTGLESMVEQNVYDWVYLKSSFLNNIFKVFFNYYLNLIYPKYYNHKNSNIGKNSILFRIFTRTIALIWHCMHVTFHVFPHFEVIVRKRSKFCLRKSLQRKIWTSSFSSRFETSTEEAFNDSR